MEKKVKKTSNLQSKVKRKNAKRKHHTQFGYSFLTIILLICLVQLSFSAILNISKVIAYHGKIATLQAKQSAAEARNAELKKDIKNFSTTASMEEIGRNSLKMAGRDEIVVIVNKPQEEIPPKDKHKKIGFKKQ